MDGIIQQTLLGHSVEWGRLSCYACICDWGDLGTLQIFLWRQPAKNQKNVSLVLRMISQMIEETVGHLAVLSILLN